MISRRQEPNVIRGILLMISCVTLFSVKDTLAKFLSAEYPVIEILFFQYVVMFIIVLPIVIYRDGWSGLSTKHSVSLLLRGAIGVSAVGLLFWAVSLIPLADATAIIFVSPIVVTLLSPILLGETVGFRRWAAVIAGFCGVLLVVQPGFEGFNAGTVVALIAGIMFGLYGIATRKLTSQEPVHIMMAYTAFVGIIGTAGFLPARWLAPELEHSAMLVAIGLISAAGHALMVLSYAAAPATIVTPFLYVSIITAAALGYFVFGDFPNLVAWLGIAIVVACGIYIAYREAKHSALTS